MAVSKAQLGGVAVALLVLLRLAAGWHFSAEGLKKLEPGFARASQGFLRAAKGPLADQYHAMAPRVHRAGELLAVPRELDDLTDAQREELAKWRRDYEARRAEAEDEDGSMRAEFPPHASYYEWATAIDQAWRDGRDAVAGAVGEEEAAEVEGVYIDYNNDLAEYLAGEEAAIDEYRHELARIKDLKSDYEAGALPYKDARVAKMQREADASLNKWEADVALLEEQYHQQLAKAAGDQADTPAVRAALNPTSPLDRVNQIVTWVVLGSGALLFFGLLTRVAAVVAAGFLLSVMASQPPWVAGAETSYFFYQLFECLGLLLLAAVGAGRWCGLDGVLVGGWRLCCGGDRAKADQPSGASRADKTEA